MTHFDGQGPMETREAMRGGQGEIHLEHLFGREETLGKLNLCARLTIQPGCSIGLHPHGPDGEFVYVLSGELTVEDNGVRRLLHAGDCTFTGGGAVHSVANHGSQPAQILGIVIA